MRTPNRLWHALGIATFFSVLLALPSAALAAETQAEIVTFPVTRAAHSAGYPAQAALGLHLFNNARSLRTMRRAHDIPEENITSMTAAFTEA